MVKCIWCDEETERDNFVCVGCMEIKHDPLEFEVRMKIRELPNVNVLDDEKVV